MCGSACAPWGSGRCAPRVARSLPWGGRVGAAELFPVHCLLQTSANANPVEGGGEESIGWAPDYQLERDELLSRKEAALQLCVHVDREEELSWQLDIRGYRGELPPYLCSSDPKQTTTRGYMAKSSGSSKGFYQPVASLFDRQLSVLPRAKRVWRCLGEWCTHTAGQAVQRQQRNCVCTRVCIGCVCTHMCAQVCMCKSKLCLRLWLPVSHSWSCGFNVDSRSPGMSVFLRASFQAGDLLIWGKRLGWAGLGC